MANKTYPSFGKVKTIVLPVLLGENLHIDEYKKKYGIDLRDILELRGSDIRFSKKTNNSLILVSAEPTDDLGYKNLPRIFVPTIYSKSYVSGSSSGELHLNIYNYTSDSSVDGGQGIVFTINKSLDFTLDNLFITGAEI